MKRAIVNLVVIALLLTGDIAWRLLSRGDNLVRNFVTLHIVAIWITWVTMVATARAAWGMTARPRKVSPAVGVVEWVCIFSAVYVLLCWLDTMWNPRDNFTTVLSFTLITLFVPSLIVSAIAYLLVGMVVRNRSIES